MIYVTNNYFAVIIKYFIATNKMKDDTEFNITK